MPFSPIPIPTCDDEREFTVKNQSNVFLFYCGRRQIVHLYYRGSQSLGGLKYGLFVPAINGRYNDPDMVAWVKALFRDTNYSKDDNHFTFSDKDFVLLKLMCE